MTGSAQANRCRGSVLLLYTLLFPTIMMFCGLGIDLTVLYVVQTRLSAAVDGAALGAGRLLGTDANTTEIAGEFLKATFPAGYFGTSNLVSTIGVTNNASLHTINVSASVQAPLLFLRILGKQVSNVGANATSVRRDVRVILVLDRSYSMINQLASLKAGASTFTNMFHPGSDELGLVVFGGSAFVAYPTSEMPNYSLTAGTGPDKNFANPVSGSGQNMLTMLDAIQLGTDTNTSEALWLAYSELKKAAAIDNDPTRANFIVLFTDGIPNGFTAYLNNPASNSLSAGSNCLYNPSTATANQQIGWLGTAGTSATLSFFNPSSSSIGLYSPVIFDTTHNGYYWATTLTGTGPGAYVNDMNEVTGTPMTNCQHIGGFGPVGFGTDMSGLATIPAKDYYGNSTSDAAYTQGILYQTYGVGYNNTQVTNGYQMALASWNVADNAAQKILSDSTMNIGIYTIGFVGNGGFDATLLQRMANTQTSPSYNSSYQTGIYYQASNSQSLQQAFVEVASQILRLTH